MRSANTEEQWTPQDTKHPNTWLSQVGMPVRSADDK